MRYLKSNLNLVAVLAIAGIAFMLGIPVGKATTALGGWRALIPLVLGAAAAMPFGGLNVTKYEDRLMIAAFYGVIFVGALSLGVAVGGGYDPLFLILEIILTVFAIGGGWTIGFFTVGKIRKNII